MKYYRIMELECDTPINNRGIGADFYYCEESETESIITAIENRQNNFDIKEITEEEYLQEIKRIQKKNFRLIAG